MVNAGVKMVFAVPEPISARYLADYLFTGHVPLNEWKTGTERPTAVGNDRVILKNRSRARHHAEHQATAISDTKSSGRMTARSQARMSAWGLAFSDGTNAAFVSAPPEAMFTPPAPLSQSAGHNRARNTTASAGSSSARSSAQHSARARGVSTTHASVHGTSIAQGESEAFVTRYEALPSSLYTLEEQFSRLTGEIMNLPKREFFLKRPGHPPLRCRSPDLTPAFNSLEFKTLMLPRFLDAATRHSRYLVPATQVDAEIAARATRILEPQPRPEPAFTEPVPLIEALERARETFNQQPPASDQTSSPGRATGKPNLRVVDGGKDSGDIPS